MSIQEASLSVPAPVIPLALPSAPPAIHRFSVEEYYEMARTGVLREGERVELLEGVICDMPPIGIPHVYSVQGLMRHLVRLLPDGWDVFVQQPISLGTSEPQPDLTIVRGSYVDYADHKPRPSEIGLVIEVADSSLPLDRVTKARIYAAAGIPEYWVVNSVERQVETHRDSRSPADGGPASYQSHPIISAGGKIPLVLDGRSCGEITAAAIFPK